MAGNFLSSARTRRPMSIYGTEGIKSRLSVRQISEPVRGDFNLFYLQYPWYRIVTAVLAGLIITALWLFLKYGKYGIWIRAT